MFGLHPSEGWTQTGTSAAGIPIWTLNAPAAGIALHGMLQLPVTLSLPGGFAVELSRELVPDANLLNTYNAANSPYRYWLDVCHVLRVRKGGVIVGEARRQHEVNGIASLVVGWAAYADRLSLQAGFFVDANGDLALYAHAFDLPVPTGIELLHPEESPVIDTTAIYRSRLASPFGRGMTLVTSAAGVSPVGAITATCYRVTPFDSSDPALSWFGHHGRLEERMPLAPDGMAITSRPTDRLAWGRQPAIVAFGPAPWGLTPLEAQGHPEWVLRDEQYYRPDPYIHHPGASRLHDGGRMVALVPPSSSHRSNVSSSSSDNARMATLQGSWADSLGWQTGTLSLPNLFGAWNEYRPAGWTAKSGTFNVPGSYYNPRTNLSVFLAVNVQRVFATNLGSASSQAAAVEVSRLIVRYAAVCRSVTVNPFGNTETEYWPAIGSVVLTEADAASLLSGAEITLSGDYTQGTYPNPEIASIPGTLKLRAVG